MRARLSSSDYPALAPLKTRADDDFTIALLDATAVMLDILTFYQERLANESYLRTASQWRSLAELSRLIAYVPAPGVSASTYLAFTLKAGPGQPANPATAAITIPKGTQVQSVPAQGQTPQTFETSANIQAKAAWNAMAVQTGQPWGSPASASMFLTGTATQLNPGDALLFLGVELETWNPSAATPSEQWEIVTINQVTVDKLRNLTLVTWDSGSVVPHQSGGSPSAWTAIKVFALRQKAALFGNSAPDPNLFVNPNDNTTTNLPSLISTTSTPWQWNGFALTTASQIDLDAAYPKIAVDGWLALVVSVHKWTFRRDEYVDVGVSGSRLSSGRGIVQSVNTSAQLYRVKKASIISRAAFGLSAKVTELAADYDDPQIGQFDLRESVVFGQSEQLDVGMQPLTYPLYGPVIDLAGLQPDLAGARVVAVSGTRQKIAVGNGITSLSFVPDDNPEQPSNLNPGDVLTLRSSQPFLSLPLPVTDLKTGQMPVWSSVSPALIGSLSVADASGRTGTVKSVSLNQFILAPPGPNDPEVSECALVASVGTVNVPYPHTQIQLVSSLSNCYDRTNATVNANVAQATHGQSVSEIMGSGSASTPNQSFQLKQYPLTFVQASTPTGRLSSLQVQVNSTAWAEVPSLYQQPPAGRVFATLNQANASTEVIFGDGVEGALLPTGQNNLQATYRIGSGTSGNVGKDSLTTLMDRPLGVSGVTNPEAAAGGQDAQSVDDIRANAPLTVLTLGRAVSIIDYRNYASAFAGIARAHALWIPSGSGRGVFLTVAGVGGTPFPSGSPVLANLLASIRNYGNPLVPITITSYVETLFKFSADLQYAPAFDQTAVQAQVFQAVADAFAFEARDFGQGVSIDEVAAVIQRVPGIVAVNVTKLWRTTSSTGGDVSSQGNVSVAQWNAWQAALISLPRLFPDTATQLHAYLPVANVSALPYPAEILVLDPSLTAASLGVMS